MKIDVLSGLDEQVFSCVGPFAMNATRIRQNGNPIVTSQKHKWYIARDKEDFLIGLCSVRFSDSSKTAQVGNLFVLSGGKRTFKSLLKRIIKDVVIEKGISLRAYANSTTLNDYKELGFEIIHQGVNWHNMKFNNDSLRSSSKKN